mmetsp:Transcript_26164/g.61024  ORF Transcript_26164/g.61024 Transcript_26164/m.61024 type:complete len:348 (+) Transcript_26164:88-1131(+)
MPHCHSWQAWQARQHRARLRGYVCARPHGYCFMQVPVYLASRAKTVLKSLELHSQHVAISGIPSHFANTAALSAKPYLSEDAYRHARAAHKAANVAKHNWALNEKASLGVADQHSLVHGTSALQFESLVPENAMPEWFVGHPLPVGSLLHRLDRGNSTVEPQLPGVRFQVASVQTEESEEGSLDAPILHHHLQREVEVQLGKAIVEVNDKWREQVQRIEENYSTALSSLREEIRRLQVDAACCVPRVQTNLHGGSRRHCGGNDYRHPVDIGVQCDFVTALANSADGCSNRCEPLHVPLQSSFGVDAGRDVSDIAAEERLFTGMTVIFHGLKNRPALKVVLATFVDGM